MRVRMYVYTYVVCSTSLLQPVHIIGIYYLDTTSVCVFVAGTAGVTVTELQSGSVDGRQRSVPTNVDPQSNTDGKHQSC